MEKKLTRLLIIIVLGIISFLFCIQSPNNCFSDTNESYTDSSVFRYIGMSIKNGDVPYRDTFDHKGLLLYFINYIGVLISHNYGIWIIELIFMFASISLAYKLARKFTSSIISLIIVTLAFSLLDKYFEGGNLTEEYALPFQLMALNIFFDFFLDFKRFSSDKLEGKNRIRLNYKLFNIPVFISGACFACVLFIRANMISVWIIFCLMVLIYCIKNKKYIELTKFIISFLLGILMITIPMMIYIIVNGALECFIKEYILFNMQYSSDINSISKIDVLIMFVNNTVTILAFVIMGIRIYNKAKNNEKCFFDLGYLLYMIATLILVSMSGYPWNHYGMTMIPTLIYPYCIMYQFLEKNDVKTGIAKTIVTVYLLYSTVVPLGIDYVDNLLNDIEISNINPTTQSIVEYIKNNTSEKDYITVFGNEDKYYYMSNRKSASKYSYQIPISLIKEEIVEEYFNDLNENKPKLIIWTARKDFTPNMINKMKNFINENNYSNVKIGNVEIYNMNGE